LNVSSELNHRDAHNHRPHLQVHHGQIVEEGEADCVYLHVPQLLLQGSSAVRSHPVPTNQPVFFTVDLSCHDGLYELILADSLMQQVNRKSKTTQPQQVTTKSGNASASTDDLTAPALLSSSAINIESPDLLNSTANVSLGFDMWLHVPVSLPPRQCV
jgi:hypothetical protein